MKWYIAKLAKVQMTLNAVFKMSTKENKNKQKRRQSPSTSLSPLVSPLLIFICLTFCSYGVCHFPCGLKWPFSPCKRRVTSFFYLHLFFIFINAFSQCKKDMLWLLFLIFCYVSICERTFLCRKLKPNSKGANKHPTPATTGEQMTNHRSNVKDL